MPMMNNTWIELEMIKRIHSDSSERTILESKEVFVTEEAKMNKTQNYWIAQTRREMIQSHSHRLTCQQISYIMHQHPQKQQSKMFLLHLEIFQTST